MAQISFEGRLTADAEIKYGNDGKPRASFTVAENFRQQNRQTQEWEDSGVTFHRVTLFGRQAESAPLVKGAVVVISGTQKSRSYEKDGEKRQWTETTTNSVGMVPVPKRDQQQSRPSPQGEQWNGGQSQGGWPAAVQPGQGQPQQDQWGGQRGGFDQDPPW